MIDFIKYLVGFALVFGMYAVVCLLPAIITFVTYNMAFAVWFDLPSVPFVLLWIGCTLLGIAAQAVMEEES